MKRDILYLGKPEEIGMDTTRLYRIEEVVTESITKGDTLSVVVFIARKGKLIYRRAFGYRTLKPKRRKANLDTIYDLTSMTKVIATVPAIIILLEQGKIRLEDRVVDWIPEFTKGALKKKVTIHHLLRHCSGLPAYENYLDKFPKGNATKEVIADICKKPIEFEPGTKLRYSDLGYMLLSEIVHRVSGEPLDIFTQKNIYQSLGMKDTMFNPPKRLWSRCAASAKRNGGTILGYTEVVQMMNGVAGNCGLFSTARDISIFGQMMLNKGIYNEKRIFSPQIIEVMTKPDPRFPNVTRGFGWDLGIPNSSLRGDIFPIGGFGQVGWTGPSLWVDPDSEIVIVIMANRLHPGEKIDLHHDYLLLRMKNLITNIVAGAIIN